MKNNRLSRKNKAFTLFELLLSMSLIAIVFAMSVPLYQNFLYRSEIDDAVNIYYKSLKMAQSYSEDGLFDSSWGVAFSNYDIVVFAGSSFVGRNSSFDRAWNIGNRFTVTGVSEVVFNKFHGTPNTTGAINITNNGITKTITVNAKGQITF